MGDSSGFEVSLFLRVGRFLRASGTSPRGADQALALCTFRNIISDTCTSVDVETFSEFFYRRVDLGKRRSTYLQRITRFGAGAAI